jgi:uncharacterized protein YuzE
MIRLSYDPSVDALYVRFIEGPVECEVIRLNDRVAINLGPDEQVVGIEVLDASEVTASPNERTTNLGYLGPA